MLLNKEMFKCLSEIQEFIKDNGSSKLDGGVLERFIKPRSEIVSQLKQANLISEDQHSIVIKGNGYMALAHYKSEKGNKRREWILIVIAIATLIKMFEPYIMLLFT